MIVKTAYFAGGCFWCMVKPFDSYPGINQVTSGYMGGHIENPTYEQVKQGQSGHLEVVEIVYQPELFTYDRLLEIFFSQIDPTDNEGQYHDRGAQYRTAVFYTDDEQRTAASHYISQLQSLYDKNIVTEVRPAATFYKAEEYHQDYYRKEPENYAVEQQLRMKYKESLVE